jgi:hypothetical protein
MAETAPVAELPVALIRCVYLLLDGASVARCSCLGAAWRAAGQDEALWATLYKREWRDGCLASGVPVSTCFQKRHRLSRWVVELARFTEGRAHPPDLQDLEATHPPQWVLHALQANMVVAQTNWSWWARAIQSWACRLLSRSLEPTSSVAASLRLLDVSTAVTLLIDQSADVLATRSALEALGAAARTRCSALGLAADDVVGRARALTNFLCWPSKHVNKLVPRQGWRTVVPPHLLPELVSEANAIAANVDGHIGLAFTGCPRACYEHTSNSSLEFCLAARCGLPITLAVVYIVVARHAGLAIEPVNAPGHFLTRLPKHALVFDLFNGSAGEVLGAEAEAHLFAAGPPRLDAVARRMMANVHNHAGNQRELDTEGMARARLIIEKSVSRSLFGQEGDIWD